MEFVDDAILCRRCKRFILYEINIENYNPVWASFLWLHEDIFDDSNHRILCKCNQVIGYRDMNKVFFNTRKLLLYQYEDKKVFVLRHFYNKLGMLFEPDSGVESEYEEETN